MNLMLLAAFLLIGSTMQARIVDRVAVIVGTRAVKDSDIQQDLRLTAFLNHEPADTSESARKKAADRLIDQVLIRNEVNTGAYPAALLAEVQALLQEVRKRYPSAAAFTRALHSAEITEENLKTRLLWQLTVLRFIDARFRPGAFVPDEEIEKYVEAHRRQLEASHPGATPAERNADAQNILSGQRINQLLDDWLKRRRNATKIVYLEDELR